MKLSLLVDVIRRARANPIARSLRSSKPVGTELGKSDARRRLRGSLQLRHVDAGSCNGCEIEIGSIFSPVYDAGQFGIALEASPRHADGLLVTGPVTRNMVDPLRTTYDAMPRPGIVVAVGDCARDCGVFRGGYGVEGSVGDILPVDVSIPGCPPEPEKIVAALRDFTQR